MVVHCLDYFDNPVAAADTLAVVARYIAVAAAAAVGIAVVEPAVVVVTDCQYGQNLAWRHEPQ
ncbi:TMhelix containing protein [Vibrio phage 1.091.O._10N.286.52.B12]|nr:TMhelix containing protein [Vibrio phage 1.091.O._10N.286.52.B12]